MSRGWHLLWRQHDLSVWVFRENGLLNHRVLALTQSAEALQFLVQRRNSQLIAKFDFLWLDHLVWQHDRLQSRMLLVHEILNQASYFAVSLDFSLIISRSGSACPSLVWEVRHGSLFNGWELLLVALCDALSHPSEHLLAISVALWWDHDSFEMATRCRHRGRVRWLTIWRYWVISLRFISTNSQHLAEDRSHFWIDKWCL